MTDLSKLITKEKFDAILFDMDGVLTATAKVHAACWKKMFDEFLKKHSAENNKPFVPFDKDADYKFYVDGKPRYDGVRSFLKSRDITLPEGTPESPPDSVTICGLGNRKNALINEVLESDGVEVYPGSLKFIKYVRDLKIRTAVVSSSKNCQAIIRAGKIEDFFETRVDGVVSSQLKLTGKPAPDIFIQAAKNLGVEPKRAVVVEDAISGVQAGRNGKFGLVVGVNREGDPQVLLDNGADVVVNDLAELLPQ
ncbi:HAD family hydrolase [Candidatus Omnitrophota bacterium]